MVYIILPKRVNHIKAKGDYSTWPKGSKFSGFSTYLGKVKMIYIDPPYNTGNDFVYNDDFAQGKGDFEQASGLFDKEGNQTIDPMQRNTESNGRFHTDWLNMIYPRLKVARDLLSEDGVIFISIDDNEVENLRKVCDEVFGEMNFIAQFVWVKKKKGSHLSKTTRSMTEYVLCFSKNDNIELFGENAYSDKLQPLAKRTNSHKILCFPPNIIETKLVDKKYNAGWYGEGSSALSFEDFEVNNGTVTTKCVVKGPFIWTQDKLNEEIRLGTKIYLSTKFGFNVLRSNQDEKIKRPSTLIDNKNNVGTNEDAYEEAIQLFQKEGIMSYPKPISLLTYVVNTITYFDKDSIILDFFSGSATTAHAVMKLNAEDGGNRKFIMVQLPEKTDEKSEAYKAGYKNICEIGKERIRRAGKKVKEEAGLQGQNLDTGFRVLKLDSSNMEDVYYTPQEFSMGSLFNENVKQDRTNEDLLFQVMLDLGIELSAKMKNEELRMKNGKKVIVHNVDDGYLMATFDCDIDEATITEIAKQQPVYFVMRDASAASDNVIDNFEQIFRHYSPDTNCRII